MLDCGRDPILIEKVIQNLFFFDQFRLYFIRLLRSVDLPLINQAKVNLAINFRGVWEAILN
jgi:hypothetical protein